MTNTSDILFQPGRIGSLAVKNRIVMAPMTRSLSPNGVPGLDVAAYTIADERKAASA
jgi:2,4-dienoyl-CoA reductase-like NADH-dependent reductase (Old Yellow Enzyme family)